MDRRYSRGRRGGGRGGGGFSRSVDDIRGALPVQALLERELRSSPKKEKDESLPIYPEERQARHPTAELVFRLFTLINSQALTKGSEVLKHFPPELTPLQSQVLGLLSVPRAGYGLQG